jgi:hypothetical protein
METFGNSWRGVCLASVVTALLAAASAFLEAADREGTAPSAVPIGRVRVDDPETIWHLRRTIDGALDWLKRPECRAVLSDFRDQSGQRLSDVLLQRGQSLEEHMQSVFFHDGRRSQLCASRHPVAVTSPGSHVILVCPQRFRELSGQPWRARATIIHEVLHSLGLGENPPSSEEITARVLERCTL